MDDEDDEDDDEDDEDEDRLDKFIEWALKHGVPIPDAE